MVQLDVLFCKSEQGDCISPSVRLIQSVSIGDFTVIEVEIEECQVNGHGAITYQCGAEAAIVEQWTMNVVRML